MAETIREAYIRKNPKSAALFPNSSNISPLAAPATTATYPTPSP